MFLPFYKTLYTSNIRSVLSHNVPKKTEQWGIGTPLIKLLLKGSVLSVGTRLMAYCFQSSWEMNTRIWLLWMILILCYSRFYAWGPCCYSSSGLLWYTCLALTYKIEVLKHFVKVLVFVLSVSPHSFNVSYAGGHVCLDPHVHRGQGNSSYFTEHWLHQGAP